MSSSSSRECPLFVLIPFVQKRTDDAIALFGDKEASGIVLMRAYADYYHVYTDEREKYHPGYVDMIDDF